MTYNTRKVTDIVTELLAQGVKQQLGGIGTPLSYESYCSSKVKELQVDGKYQRLISPNKINGYGIFNRSLCIPVVVSRRPSSVGTLYAGEHIIDGQNKVVKYLLSGLEEALPVVVLNHKEDSTYDEVLKTESELFNQLNTWVKKLDTIDNLRSEVCFGDEFAIHVETTLKTLNLKCVPNTFGSEESDAFPLKSFTHFYYAVKDDYPKNALGTLEIQEAYKFWKKIYIETPVNFAKNPILGLSCVPPQEYLNGSTFRCIAMLHKFINEGLSNGRQKAFKEWCVGRIACLWNQQKLHSGFSGMLLPRMVLWKIIDKYNEEVTNTSETGSVTLGTVTLYEAAQVNEKFKHPDEDRWAKIVKKYKKIKEDSSQSGTIIDD